MNISILYVRQCGFEKSSKNFSKLLTFSSLQPVISERATFSEEISFRGTLKISYPAQIDTRQ